VWFVVKNSVCEVKTLAGILLAVLIMLSIMKTNMIPYSKCIRYPKDSPTSKDYYCKGPHPKVLSKMREHLGKDLDDSDMVLGEIDELDGKNVFRFYGEESEIVCTLRNPVDLDI